MRSGVNAFPDPRTSVTSRPRHNCSTFDQYSSVLIHGAESALETNELTYSRRFDSSGVAHGATRPQNSAFGVVLRMLGMPTRQSPDSCRIDARRLESSVSAFWLLIPMPG